MWIDEQGRVYIGDCRPGDRKATEQEFASWQAALAATVPDQISAAKLLRQLAEDGDLPAVDAAVSAAGGLAKRLWDRASHFERSDPLVAAIGTAIGKTSRQIDELFARAKLQP